MKSKTRRAKPGLDLGMMAVEQTPQGKAISTGVRVVKDIYELYTGKRFKMPRQALTWAGKFDRMMAARDRAFDRRIERRLR